MNAIDFTIIGFIAATCTTVSFIPQAIQIIKTKKTKDISLSMYLIFTIGIFSWLVYGLGTNNIPIIIANAITLVFSGTILILKIKYK